MTDTTFSFASQTRSLVSGWSWRKFTKMLVLSVAVAALAGCASTPKKSTRTKSKEYFSEKKYGVKASPRVADADDKIRKGGGRYLVGKPYKVAGKWYKPRETSSYSKTGKASWYGSAFHGRLTANGEVYDMNSLTAAHPTLPLPSYVRVTNLANNRSVVVRVNDRGPFHGNRVIDLSKRTAELLDYKRFGVARVHVEYVGRAPLHGHDNAYLVASYRGPGHPGSDLPEGLTNPGATQPGTMLASIDGVQMRASSGNAPTPRMRPFAVPIQATLVAYDPATAFSAPSANAGVMVASLESQQVPSERAAAPAEGTSLIDTPIPEQPAPTAKQSSATSTYSPDQLPMIDEEPASKGVNARAVRTVPVTAPVRRANGTLASAPVKTVRVASRETLPEAAGAQTRGAPPRSLGTLPARSTYGTGGPFHPIPPASVGSSSGPMVLINSDASTSATVAGALFYAPGYRVAEAHGVLATAATGSIPLSVLAARRDAERSRLANAADKVQVGIFGSEENVARLEKTLKTYGTVETRHLTVDGRTVTSVSLAAFAPGITADAAVRAAEAMGAKGAYVVRDGTR